MYVPCIPPLRLSMFLFPRPPLLPEERTHPPMEGNQNFYVFFGIRLLSTE